VHIMQILFLTIFPVNFVIPLQELRLVFRLQDPMVLTKRKLGVRCIDRLIRLDACFRLLSPLYHICFEIHFVYCIVCEVACVDALFMRVIVLVEAP